MNTFQKIVYFFLEMQEKTLRRRLSKHLKTSGANSTSKTVFGKGVTMTLNAETQKNPEKLLQFAESKGTKVYKIDNADKILNIIKEEEGLITPLEGIEALYINIITNSGFSFKSKPMFIMRNGSIDPYYMVHQFYKWYAMEMKLPGFDFMSQKIFKIYLNSDGALLSNLNLDEMIGLKEAINRDREATDFAIQLAKTMEGSKKVLKKMQDNGANI